MKGILFILDSKLIIVIIVINYNPVPEAYHICLYTILHLKSFIAFHNKHVTEILIFTFDRNWGLKIL